MKYSIVASMLFAAFGNSPGLAWILDGSILGEPVRLTLWGVALITFSSSLRGRLRAPATQETRVAVPPTMERTSMGATMARPA